MNRRVQILTIVFMLAVASAVSAQTSETCGIVDIIGLSTADSGTQLVFKVRVTNMLHISKPEFKWSISAGTITSGQLTDEITVDTTGLGGLDLRATVELTGLPLGCKSSASKTTQVKQTNFTCGLPFDSYGDIKFEHEKARLDNFAIQISNQLKSSGLILMSAGQKTFKSEAVYRLNRARSYLESFRGIDSSRIITFDCGFAPQLTTTLWVVPTGARVPECSSWNQIPLSEVKFTKPRPKSSRKHR